MSLMDRSQETQWPRAPFARSPPLISLSIPEGINGLAGGLPEFWRKGAGVPFAHHRRPWITTPRMTEPASRPDAHQRLVLNTNHTSTMTGHLKAQGIH